MDTLVSTCKSLMIKLGIAKRLHYRKQHVQPSQDLVAQQLDNALASTIHREAIQHLRDQRREAAPTSISEPQQNSNSQPSSSGQHRVIVSGTAPTGTAGHGVKDDTVNHQHFGLFLRSSTRSGVDQYVHAHVVLIMHSHLCFEVVLSNLRLATYTHLIVHVRASFFLFL